MQHSISNHLVNDIEKAFESSEQLIKIKFVFNKHYNDCKRLSLGV